MYKDIFTQLGLSLNEAIIYEYLLKYGETVAGDIIKNTPLKRGVVYNVLTSLKDKALISEKKLSPKNGVAKISHFSPNHPEKLRDFAKEKEGELQKAEHTLEANMNKLISDFNLISNQPGIRYFEGIEGIKKVIYDTFNRAENEIVYTYADIEKVNQYIKKINDEYAIKRDKDGLYKKILFSDTPYTREHLKTYHTKTTESKIMTKVENFYTVMQIYNNKVSYITLSDNVKIGIIIENKEIYQTQKVLFENAWKNAESIYQATSDSKHK